MGFSISSNSNYYFRSSFGWWADRWLCPFVPAQYITQDIPFMGFSFAF